MGNPVPGTGKWWLRDGLARVCTLRVRRGRNHRKVIGSRNGFGKDVDSEFLFRLIRQAHTEDTTEQMATALICDGGMDNDCEGEGEYVNFDCDYDGRTDNDCDGTDNDCEGGAKGQYPSVWEATGEWLALQPVHSERPDELALARDRGDVETLLCEEGIDGLLSPSQRMRLANLRNGFRPLPD